VWLTGDAGAIGVVAALPADAYELLARVQREMARVVPGVGGLDHARCVRREVLSGGSDARAGGADSTTSGARRTRAVSSTAT
jgi:hypothetical protein